MSLQKFMKEAECLIIQPANVGRVKKSQIKHVESYRSQLEKLQQPIAPIAVRLLDEFVEFAHIVNRSDLKVAEIQGKKISATIEEIMELIKHG